MQTFPGEKKSFHGFTLYDNGDTKVVVPHEPADGMPWVWRARFWNHEPAFDIAMLQQGYHVVYCNVTNLLGSPKALKRWDAFYEYLRFEHLFADRMVLEGMSRGGLPVYNWAAKNPEKVAAIYADNPVMDFKSWPGGKGKSDGSPGVWKHCLASYEFTEEEAMAYEGNPLDNLEPLARAGIPILHVVGDQDEVVPVDENTLVAQERYLAMGGIFELIVKQGAGHHPHGLEDPQPIVDFVLKHNTGGKAEGTDAVKVSRSNFHLRGSYQNSRAIFEQTKRGHVAFLGGSITEMDGYRPMVCAMLEERFPETVFQFTNAGISSTCSDTGAFRLQRDVLSKGPVDLLFVEFTVNDDQDGVYSRERAVRGMEGILAQVRKHNPKADVVMTQFVNATILSALRAGKPHGSHGAHVRVAEHYHIANNDLAQELADRIQEGTMDWKGFGGVHPNKIGNGMCARMIEEALLAEWAKPLPAGFEPVAHPSVPLLDPMSYVNGRFVSLDDIERDDTWQISVPDWGSIEGSLRPRFADDTMIHSESVGSKLTIRFNGTAIGAYVLSGPDAGRLRCKILGGPSREVDLLHRFSHFQYPQTIMFFDELAPGDHVLELEILDNEPGRLYEGGTALRVLTFTAN